MQREKGIQAQIVALLRTVCGRAAVFVLGTRRGSGDYPGTRQSPGLPDVIAFVPCKRHPRNEACGQRVLLTVEVKAPSGRLSPAQRTWTAYMAACAMAAGAPVHVVGGFEDVAKWLMVNGNLAAPAWPRSEAR